MNGTSENEYETICGTLGTPDGTGSETEIMKNGTAKVSLGTKPDYDNIIKRNEVNLKTENYQKSKRRNWNMNLKWRNLSFVRVRNKLEVVESF